LIRMEVVIEKMVHGGQGMGRDEEGRIVFIDRGYPGEIVDVEITRERKDFRFGRICSFIYRSPKRSGPVCGVWNECGGCDWLDYEYESQIQAKQKILEEQFLRTLGIDLTPFCQPFVGSPELHHYRNKMEYFHQKTDSGYRICLHSRFGFRGVIPEGCKVAPKVFGRILKELSKGDFQNLTETTHTVLRISKSTGAIALIWVGLKNPDRRIERAAQMIANRFPVLSSVTYVIHSGRKAALDGRAVPLIGEPFLEETICGFRYIIPSTSFFQINVPVAEMVLETIKALWSPTPKERVLDLYGGVGLFSVFFGSLVREIVTVELNKASVSAARKNAKVNNIPAMKAESAKCATFLRSQPQNRWDTIIMDPPKSGVEKEVISEIIRIRPKRMIYVSCDPASLTRDLKLLTDSGFLLDHVQGLDMFPHTGHFESITVLKGP